ncbi:hypothetical protein EKL32_11245 [Flavobacterium sp. GSN2]|nr:hypothetical protein EKL32_11245 [Flavobacterium sp. GSN2]
MEVKQLMNVNESALPKAIRREFNKIYLEFRGGYNDTCTIIKPYSFLTNEHRKGKLFENEINEEVFVSLRDEKFTKYWEAYHKGFKKGYSEFDGFLTNLPFNDSDNKTRINRVFNGVYNKFNRLHPLLIQIENNGYLIIKSHLQEFGFEVGTFIKCWDIILNNHNLFEEIFNSNYTKNVTTPLTVPTTGKTKQNKSLLFDGKELNLLERFKIADKVLDIDKKLRILNIGDLEKYQLLAYILGCNKDNARNLMNGSYKAKDRDLTTYFNDLDLNK